MALAGAFNRRKACRLGDARPPETTRVHCGRCASPPPRSKDCSTAGVAWDTSGCQACRSFVRDLPANAHTNPRSQRSEFCKQARDAHDSRDWRWSREGSVKRRWQKIGSPTRFGKSRGRDSGGAGNQRMGPERMCKKIWRIGFRETSNARWPQSVHGTNRFGAELRRGKKSH